MNILDILILFFAFIGLLRVIDLATGKWKSELK